MNNPSLHPPEDSLIAHAMGAGTGDIRSHVDGCAACGRFVREMRAVHTALAGLGDEDVPSDTGRRLIQSVYRTRPPLWLSDLWLNWFTNPLVLSMAFLFYIVVIYFCLIFLQGFGGEMPRP